MEFMHNRVISAILRIGALLISFSIAGCSLRYPKTITITPSTVIESTLASPSQYIAPTSAQTRSTVTPQPIEAIHTATVTHSAKPSFTPTSVENYSKVISRCNANRSPLTGNPDNSDGGVMLFLDTGKNGVWGVKSTMSNVFMIWPDNTATLGVSPDHTRLKFTIKNSDGVPQKYVITSVDGRILGEYPWQADWPSLGWFRNAALGVTTETGVRLISPETGEEIGFFEFPVLPNLQGATYHPNDYWEVNRDLTKVAYQSFKEGSEAGLLIFDLKDNKVIANVGKTRLPPLLGNFMWSPNGDLLMYIGNVRPGGRDKEEIYLFDENGTGGQISNFHETYPDLFAMHFVSWSPNQRYLAFWANIETLTNVSQDVSTNLFVFDIEEKTLIDFCLSYQYDQTASVWSLGQGWSLDSQHIITKPGNFDTTPEIILDINTGEILEIPGNINVLGWGR